MSDPECPFESLHNTITSNSRDMSADKRDAWLYGIIVGWKPEAMRSIAERLRWTDDDVKRLRRLRARYLAAFRKAPPY